MKKKLFLALGTMLLSGVLSARMYRIDNERGVQEVIAQITADKPDEVQFLINSDDSEQKTVWLNGVFAGIPEDIKRKISRLDLAWNVLQTLPNLAGFTGLKSLDLNYNKLSEPPNLAGLMNLEILDLSVNLLQTSPKLAELTKLKSLDLNYNKLSEPPNLAGLMNLEILDLSFNWLQTPPNLTGLTKLRMLDLSNNRLTSRPDTTSQSPEIIIHLKGNPITEKRAR